MSYCEIIAFRDGVPAESKEFKNSYGGCAFVWDALYTKYLKDPKNKYENWLTAGKPLWDLAKKSYLRRFERIVLASTFDRAIIGKKDFADYAKCLRMFESAYHDDAVCHLPEWADFVDTCDAEAIGFYGMSVSEYLWEVHSEDETRPYNLNSDDNEISFGQPHFDVYEYVLGV